MAKEIEKKWLLSAPPTGTPYETRVLEQGYIALEGDTEVRVARYRGVEDSYTMTVKKGKGLVREEVDLHISDEHGAALWAITPNHRKLSKIRDLYKVTIRGVEQEGMKWEVDTYLGRHAGLVVVELELASAAAYVPGFPVCFPASPREVTDVAQFKNKWLASADPVELAALFVEFNIHP